MRPNYLLMWEASKWAKEQGCRAYDLWGIPDEVGWAVSEGQELPAPDRTDGLWGVYQFKSGFSKNIVYYTGAYDYVYSPLLYTLITNRFFNIENDGSIFRHAGFAYPRLSGDQSQSMSRWWSR